MSRDLIELTIFRKSGGPLTKRIALGPDGAIKSDGSQCIMPRGSARRFAFGSMGEFANLIGALHSDEALALGVLRDDLPAEVGVVTKGKLNGANQHGIIARSQEYVIYRPGLAGRPRFSLISTPKECRQTWRLRSTRQAASGRRLSQSSRN